MPFSSRAELLDCWERAHDQSIVDKALTLLAAAQPETTLEELSNLRLGERDSRLLALRTALFGPALRSVASCPHCSTALEFTLDAREFIAAGDTPPDSSTGQLTVGNLSLQLRPVSSRDLRAIIPAADVSTAQRLLCQMCVVSALHEGVPVAVSELSDETLAEVARALAGVDPSAELLMELTCEACQRSCTLVFDVASFLWAEVDTLARRLLRDVHALAWAYGWRESDILALSDARRRFYLEMVS